ncbi:unnamed protein product [Arctogadus glacialis]
MIWWNFKDWVQVSHGDQSVLQMSHMTLQVMSEIERRSLCFSKHLEVYREHGMPWMATAEAPKGDEGRFAPQHADLHLLCGPGPEWRLHRFREPERPLPTNELGGRVTGQTAAAADPGEIHPGQSEESEDLEPASDRLLQVAETRDPIPSLRPPPPSAEKDCVDPLEDVDDQDELRPPVVSAAKCLPANSGQRWGMDEESIISKQSQVTHQVAYQEYVKACRNRKLPSRSFVAFKRKRRRLMT